MYHMKPNYEIFESRIQKLLYKNIAAIMQIMIIIIYHKSFSWIVYMANIARKNFIVSRDVVTSTFILPIFQLSFARLSFNAMKEAGSIWKVSNYTEATAANAAQLLNFFNFNGSASLFEKSNLTFSRGLGGMSGRKQENAMIALNS